MEGSSIFSRTLYKDPDLVMSTPKGLSFILHLLLQLRAKVRISIYQFPKLKSCARWPPAASTGLWHEGMILGSYPIPENLVPPVLNLAVKFCYCVVVSLCAFRGGGGGIKGQLPGAGSPLSLWDPGLELRATGWTGGSFYQLKHLACPVSLCLMELPILFLGESMRQTPCLALREPRVRPYLLLVVTAAGRHVS